MTWHMSICRHSEHTVGQGSERKAAQHTQEAGQPTTPWAGPTRRFQYQFQCFFLEGLWSSNRQKHAAAQCLLFRTLDLGLKSMGHRHMCAAVESSSGEVKLSHFHHDDKSRGMLRDAAELGAKKKVKKWSKTARRRMN